ncbi:MAG: hypothetical protein KDC13_01860 [Bacteroidetes bacterium]|nr:hypothetical protein [Bacteroidota bacterium]
MKSGIYLSFAALLIAFSIGMGSCRKNKVKGCTDTNATNYSVDAEEDNGTCEYERDKFLGNWDGTKNCVLNPLDSTTVISITRDAANIKGIILNDFPDDGLKANAVVNNSDPDKFVIPSQTIVNDLDQYSLSGDGVVYQNTMVINFLRIYDVSTIDTCGMGLDKIQ